MVMTAEQFHIPVMVDEVMRYLAPRPGEIFVDATAGSGGHSRLILERILPGGRLVCIDRDQEALATAKERVGGDEGSCSFVHANFCDIDAVLKGLGIKAIDGILLDLGVSSLQLANPGRGFSFQSDGPLDMRLDRDSYISAYDLVNNLNEDEIAAILRNFGEERWHRRIAHLVAKERQRLPIATTSQLAALVVRAIPPKYRHPHYRIHPATRTFQAIRIAVNRELEALETVLSKAIDLLKPQGRICVISFHSLEDRIVKRRLRAAAASGEVKILTPKPLTPLQSEIEQNPSSRSSKLRAAQRCAPAHQ
jgi:16S rRNA (cytosine1402-N4)-methyltransferase